MTRTWRRRLWRGGLAALAGLVAAAAGCSRPLPEEGSEAANLYVARCAGTCHRPYQPASMTAAMWQLQVARMLPVIVRAGLPPVSARERDTLLAYLERNAEGHGAAAR